MSNFQSFVTSDNTYALAYYNFESAEERGYGSLGRMKVRWTVRDGNTIYIGSPTADYDLMDWDRIFVVLDCENGWDNLDLAFETLHGPNPLA